MAPFLLVPVARPVVNEVVLDANILRQPGVVQAIFLSDCRHKPGRMPGKNTELGLAKSCAEAHNHARKVHRAFLRAYSVSNRTFPLLRFRPWNWQEPFTVA